MTGQILMFSFSALPNYLRDFCQPEELTDVLVGEPHHAGGKAAVRVAMAGLVTPPCQRGAQVQEPGVPVLAQDRMLWAGTRPPSALQVHLGPGRPGAWPHPSGDRRSHRKVAAGEEPAPPSHTLPTAFPAGSVSDVDRTVAASPASSFPRHPRAALGLGAAEHSSRKWAGREGGTEGDQKRPGVWHLRPEGRRGLLLPSKTGWACRNQGRRMCGSRVPLAHLLLPLRVEGDVVGGLTRLLPCRHSDIATPLLQCPRPYHLSSLVIRILP